MGNRVKTSIRELFVRRPDDSLTLIYASERSDLIPSERERVCVCVTRDAAAGAGAANETLLQDGDGDLRPGLRAEHDYVLVTTECFEQLMQWYGSAMHIRLQSKSCSAPLRRSQLRYQGR
jgi:hypothetical protein